MRIAVFFCAICACASSPSLIPKPVSLEVGNGKFELRERATIQVPTGDADAARVGAYLASAIRAPTGFQLRVRARKHGTIVLRINPQITGGKEAYELDVAQHSVLIQSPSAAGLFYGVQTFLQLLPPEVESRTQAHVQWAAPCVKISDYPRFAWRGLMLDVSRNFFTKVAVETYIDQMAKYKYNVFHWHLTDDNGWRIEIKSLPQLTATGGWRVPRIGRWGDREPPQEGEAATDGGFYTQDDIRDVVAYARERFITVVPEVDVPGHSLALIASYPEASCTGDRYPVNPGSKFYGKQDNALCPGNERSFQILDQVFTEIAPLFPSEYVHVGGDECFKGFWKTCSKCQLRMAQEHLKDENELQSYFIRRLEKILASKGKKLIGWDEILEGGLAPTATVMSWRGMEGGIAAAKMNHAVIMTPSKFVYLDLYQGDPTLEPDTYSMARVSTSYSFDPVPERVDPKYILGGQGNLWTESVPTLRHAEYMTWPRAFALSEAYWSPKESRNWDDFSTRMEAHFQRLDAAQVNYATAVYDVMITPLLDDQNKLSIQLSTELTGSDIYYTFDGTNPDNTMPKYPGGIVPVPRGATVVRAVAYRDGKRSGRMLILKVTELEARARRK